MSLVALGCYMGCDLRLVLSNRQATQTRDSYLTCHLALITSDLIHVTSDCFFPHKQHSNSKKQRKKNDLSNNN